MDNYLQLLERIAQSAGLPKEEVERKIEAKRAKLSGLISKEGAAQIVAAELGISFDNELLNLSELLDGMKRAHVLGVVTQVLPIREYNKNGKEGKIGSFLLGDKTSNARVVLWDTNHIGLIEEKKIKEGDTIEILNASVRGGELHLSAFSDLKMSKEKIKDVKTARTFSSGNFKDAQPGAYMKVRATVVQMYDPKYFDDKQSPDKKRALFNIILDDGSETMRGVLGDRHAEKLGLTTEEVFSLEQFNEKKKFILGEEKYFVGNFKMNTYFNKIEMNIENIEEVNVDTLIKELESASISL